ncbi:MAG: GAF domain-containing protein, partial [Planctomycetes bacterium]|nr:GAF domain-containing protein [Planctomycetota bacterium]
MRIGLSIGQRLGLGFGVAALLLAALGVVTLLVLARTAELREDEAAAAAAAETARAVELATLKRGIAARTYVLTRDERHLATYRAVAADARRVRSGLTAPADDADARALAARASADLEVFAREADEFVEHARAGAEHAQIRERERALTDTREVAFASLAALSHHLEGLASARRAHVAAARGDLQLRVPLTLLGVVCLLGVTALLTIRAVRGPARELMAAADSLAAGDHEAAAALATTAGPEEQGELAHLARAFGRMALALRAREERLAASAGLASSLAATLDVTRLCEDGLAALVAHVRAELGAVYLVTPEGGALRRHAAFALDGGEETLALGEGIPGQAARSNATLLVKDLPPDAPFRARFGFEALPPRVVVAVPLTLRAREVVGVVVVGSVRDLPDGAVEFLEHSAKQLAVSVENARAHARVQVLAGDLNDKNEELQAQNEELHAQQEELQAQQEELQVQQEELQAQRDELETRQEQLVEADRRKDEFLAVLSHELRNPLMPLRIGLEVLGAATDGERRARVLETMERQVGHLTRLVDDLLDVARITRGKVQVRRRPLDLCRLVRDVVEDHRGLIEKQDLSLDLALPEEAVAVDGDADRLAQVVGNVVHNAVKFTPPGGQVSVRLERPAAGGVVRLVVRDTGIGMPPDVLARVFQPFTQADRSLARTRGGLGLGLALARGLVELHGGTVRAESQGDGLGAAVTVEL